MTVVVGGVDVGGSGRAAEPSWTATPDPSGSGAGLRISPAASTWRRWSTPSCRSFRPHPTSSLHPCGASPASWTAVVMASVRNAGAQQVWVCGDALAAMVGAVGSVRPGGVVAADGAVALDGLRPGLASGGRLGTHPRRPLLVGLGRAAGARGGSADPRRCGQGGEALLAAATEQLGPPDTWPRMAMTWPDAVAVIAGLAPAVTALAPSDGVAAWICAQAGRELARPSPPPRRASRGYACRAPAASGAAPVPGRLRRGVCVPRLQVQPLPGTGLDGAVPG